MKTGPKLRSLRSRFEEKYIPEPNSGCWLWIGYLNAGRYGYIGLGGRGQPDIEAHRASWMLHRGEIPDGLYVLHKCDVPSCVNPDHLFLGTQIDNMQDAAAKGRTCRGDRMREAQRGKLPTGAAHYVNRLGRERDKDGRFA